MAGYLITKALSFPVIFKGNAISFQEAERQFFTHTSGRWLYNEEAQRKARYAPFSVGALMNIAGKTVGSPVRHIQKLVDKDNRAFNLVHENGVETIARIPTPINGPPGLVTASEVATIDFVRRLGLPVPKVLEWSALAQSTEVGSPFILMEKVAGTTLQEVSLMHGVRIDDFLVDVPEDVDVSPFCVGPIARRDFWDDERLSMKDIFPGPWTCALDFARDTAAREQKWIANFAKPHMEDSWLCCIPHQGREDDHIDFLERYKTLLPYLIPKDPRHLHGHLWHPRLDGDTLFVVPSTSSRAPGEAIKVDISACITWPGATIEPAFLQLATPASFRNLYALCSAFEGVYLPDFSKYEANTLETGEKDKALHDHFERIAFEGLGIDDAHLPNLVVRKALDVMARKTWRTGLIPFKQALVEVTQNFSKIAPGALCPISFTPNEIAQHNVAYEGWAREKLMAAMMMMQLHVEQHGYVRAWEGHPDHFEQVQQEVEKWHEIHMMLPQEETEGDGYSRALTWPLRNTLDDHPRSHCYPAYMDIYVLPFYSLYFAQTSPN
ncbi:hypothetical protein BDN70DRAFT_898043 [Pholiota conissans]|uniref:Altered inheritance of mitochondria protein 9, mitochondrial n=1 Tax=Pholiota conissans TaxID=109636 RepID=A0A9P5YUC4_9AGAR|nr:hypothetical protein BDN70DRAFT_898043 [Pholiota conissans]